MSNEAAIGSCPDFTHELLGRLRAGAINPSHLSMTREA
jgi:hypothetical protein